MLRRTSLVFGLLLMAAFAMAASPSGVPSLTSNEAAPDDLQDRRVSGEAKTLSKGWRVLDFEGVGNLLPVDDLYDGIHFSNGWQGLVDSDEGGNGNFANEPSPDTVAFVPDPDTTTPEILVGTVTFDEPVAGIGFHYATVTQLVFGIPLSVSLFDGNGSLLGQYTASDTPIFTGGDPEGAFTEWYAVDIVLTGNSIARADFVGGGSYFAVDDFRYVRYRAAHGDDEDGDEDGD